jgi:hypothetical protein
VGGGKKLSDKGKNRNHNQTENGKLKSFGREKRE